MQKKSGYKESLMRLNVRTSLKSITGHIMMLWLEQ